MFSTSLLYRLFCLSLIVLPLTRGDAILTAEEGTDGKDDQSQLPYAMRVRKSMELLETQRSMSSKLARSLTPERLQEVVTNAYNLHKNNTDGKNADYIPYLATVNSSLFGVAIVTTDGRVYTAGDVDYSFSIQSCSKVFTLAQIMDAIGPEAVVEKIGVEPTGLPFNSILALGLYNREPVNPLVNAGALSAVSLVDGANKKQKFKKILAFESAMAGESLDVINEVYVSESETNYNNRGIANILFGTGYLYAEPMGVVDAYTKQCSIGVSAKQLGMMAATLANGGVNPVTHKKVIKNADIVKHVLSVMLTAGFYDESGFWSYETGLPAKTGVGGGIFVVVPNVMSVVAFAPPLDERGNSVRASLAINYIGDKLGLNMFAQRKRKGRYQRRAKSGPITDTKYT